MNSLIAFFNHPAALLLAPLAWLLLWRLYLLQRDGSYWQQKLPPAFLPWLLQQPAQRQHKAPWRLLASAATLAALALAAPQLPGSKHASPDSPDPLVIVIELTPDMLASDLPPSRLHQLRDKAASMLRAQIPGQTAMVVYAGSAHTLLPLSADPEMADNLLQALHPSLLPRTGRDAAAAVAKALQLLQQGANGHGRIALLTRQLDRQERTVITRLLRQHPQVRLGIIGVGTLQGAPVPVAGNGQLDPGQPLSRLHEASLQKLARQSRTGYTRLQYDNADLLQSGLFVRNTAGNLQAASSHRKSDQGYWLLLPLLLLLAPLARKGWLFALLPLLMLLPPATPLQAAETTSSILEKIEREPAAALQQLQDPLWLGIAAYHAGNYQLAHDYFSGLDGSIAHYNRGNSLMQLGRYPAAAAAYRQALQHEPELQQALDNLALARQLQEQAEATAAANTGTTGTSLQSSANRQETNGKAATLQAPDPVHPHGSLDTWLQQIPDNPAVLLRRKFRQELSQPAP